VFARAGCCCLLPRLPPAPSHAEGGTTCTASPAAAAGPAAAAAPSVTYGISTTADAWRQQGVQTDLHTCRLLHCRRHRGEAAQARGSKHG
jgi:hypothetical protein